MWAPRKTIRPLGLPGVGIHASRKRLRAKFDRSRLAQAEQRLGSHLYIRKLQVLGNVIDIHD